MDNMDDMKNACDSAILKKKRKYIRPEHEVNYLKTPEIENLRKAKLAASWKYQKAKKHGTCKELRQKAKQAEKELQLAIRIHKDLWNQKITNLVEDLKRNTIHEDESKVIDNVNIFGKAKQNSSRTATNSKIANQNVQYQQGSYNCDNNIPPAASIPLDKKFSSTYFGQS